MNLGTRISIELVDEFLAAGEGEEKFLSSYPHLSREDICASLALAALIAREWRLALGIPEFQSEQEEADWWDRHPDSVAELFRRAAEAGANRHGGQAGDSS
jgi:hypothetical protein